MVRPRSVRRPHLLRLLHPRLRTPRRTRLRHAYFASLALASSAVLRLLAAHDDPAAPAGAPRRPGYVDGLVLAVSALTGTGLSPVPPGAVSGAQRGLLAGLMVLGSAVWVSFWVLVLGGRREGGKGYAAASWDRGGGRVHGGEVVAIGTGSGTASVSLRSRAMVTTARHHQCRQSGGKVLYDYTVSPPPPSPIVPWTRPALDPGPLPEEQHALNLLALAIPLYTFLCLSLGTLAISAHLETHPPPPNNTRPPHPLRSAISLAISAFTNTGMSVLPPNHTPLHASPPILCTYTLLILAGRAALPASLRLILSAAHATIPFSRARAGLGLALASRRRILTHLLPARQTWWLVFVLVTTTGVGWAAFGIAGAGQRPVQGGSSRILDGLLQAVSANGAGFHVIPASELHVALQLFYIAAMYLSAFPLLIAMRHADLPASHPPEPQLLDKTDDPELGLHARHMSQPQPVLPFRLNRLLSPSGRGPLLGRQLRAQLLHDAWWLPSVVLLVALLECRPSYLASSPDPGASIFEAGSVWQKEAPGSTLLGVAFEVVSAYGCVGVSVGSFGGPASLCGDWGVVSKVVLVWAMLKGRQRGVGIVLGEGRG